MNFDQIQYLFLIFFMSIVLGYIVINWSFYIVSKIFSIQIDVLGDNPKKLYVYHLGFAIGLVISSLLNIILFPHIFNMFQNLIGQTDTLIEAGNLSILYKYKQDDYEDKNIYEEYEEESEEEDVEEEEEEDE